MSKLRSQPGQLVVGVELDALGRDLDDRHRHGHAAGTLQEELHAHLDLLEIRHLIGREEEVIMSSLRSP